MATIFNHVPLQLTIIRKITSCTFITRSIFFVFCKPQYLRGTGQGALWCCFGASCRTKHNILSNCA